jgi:protein PhnA
MDIKVRDSNGALLAEGDSVTLIKDLKLKGSSTVLKRGTMIRGIHLTDNADEIEGAPTRSRAWCCARSF